MQCLQDLAAKVRHCDVNLFLRAHYQLEEYFAHAVLLLVDRQVGCNGKYELDAQALDVYLLIIGQGQDL